MTVSELLGNYRASYSLWGTGIWHHWTDVFNSCVSENDSWQKWCRATLSWGSKATVGIVDAKTSQSPSPLGLNVFGFCRYLGCASLFFVISYTGFVEVAQRCGKSSFLCGNREIIFIVSIFPAAANQCSNYLYSSITSLYTHLQHSEIYIFCH